MLRWNGVETGNWWLRTIAKNSPKTLIPNPILLVFDTSGNRPVSDWAALCYGSWQQVKPAIRSRSGLFSFLLSYVFFFEERGENIKTLHLIYFVCPGYYFPNPMAFYRFLSAKPLKKKQEATGTHQVNEAKVLFAQGDRHVAAIRTY